MTELSVIAFLFCFLLAAYGDRTLKLSINVGDKARLSTHMYFVQ
jgi:hypothetical protein